jgi:hypothetical protein
MIPPREPVGDPFTGVILKSGDHYVLAFEPVSGADVIAGGTFVLRYAVQYLGKPHWSIVPGLIALDYGEMLIGEAAWEFLLKRSNLHPRADVLGYRNDGKDEMVTIKTLDLAQPIGVLAYADADATQPIAPISALIAPSQAELAPRLRDYLPRYDILADWQAAHE